MNLTHDEDGTLHGADDLVGSVRIDLSDLDIRCPLDEEEDGIEFDNDESYKLIGIEVEKVSPEEGNLFGFWAVVYVEGTRQTMVDEFYPSLMELCDHYRCTFNEVADRLALKLLQTSSENPDNDKSQQTLETIHELIGTTQDETAQDVTLRALRIYLSIVRHMQAGGTVSFVDAQGAAKKLKVALK
jgi:hypothetical protein